MTNVDIGKLYGVCRRFIDVWDDHTAEPAAFGPAVEELREVLGATQAAEVAALKAAIADIDAHATPAGLLNPEDLGELLTWLMERRTPAQEQEDR